MSRVVRFHSFGGPEVLRIEHVPERFPEPGEVRIHVKAIGLNRAEANLRRGFYLEAPTLPSSLGYEAAGVVDAIGDGVTGLAEGDAVSVIPPTSMIRWPAYGETAVFPAELLVKHPATLSWVEAAALWMPLVTAYGALVDVAAIQPGDHVIVTAASSSVGIAAIQVANMIGSIPIAVTRSQAKADALRSAGAAHVVVTDEQDLSARLADIVGTAGAAVAFDSVGGEIVEPLARALGENGMLIAYGALGGTATPLPFLPMLERGLWIRGFLFSEIVKSPTRREAAIKGILGGLESGALKPVIAKTFPFEQIVEAHRYLESNEQFGKVVVAI